MTTGGHVLGFFIHLGVQRSRTDNNVEQVRNRNQLALTFNNDFINTL